ncbi:hypothetical protein EGW08_020458 [Elysia chlorotica]|uniref:Uncharacterized protein n=1 Tax=Elysia chlorotica TaxID=188477 RepID=A0A3S0ZCF0_ELYCH|nr:hypothetical protein EGW08_020458 [Elysia chlorotica]
MKNTNLKIANGLMSPTSTYGEIPTVNPHAPSTVDSERMTPSDVHTAPDAASPLTGQVPFDATPPVTDPLRGTVHAPLVTSARQNTGRRSVLHKPLAALTPFFRAITKPRTSTVMSPETSSNHRPHASSRNFRPGSAAKNTIFPSRSLRPDFVSTSPGSAEPVPLANSPTLRPNSKTTASHLLALATSRAVNNFRPLITGQIDPTSPQPSVIGRDHQSKDIDVSTANSKENNNKALQPSSYALLEDRNGHLKTNPLQSSASISNLESPHNTDQLKSSQNLIPLRPITQAPASTPAPFIKPKAFQSKLANPNFSLHNRLNNHQAFPKTPRTCASRTDYDPPLVPTHTQPSAKQPPQSSGEPTAIQDASPASSKRPATDSPAPGTPSSTGSRDAIFTFTIPSRNSSSSSINLNNDRSSLSSNAFCTSSGDDSENSSSLTKDQKRRKNRKRQAAVHIRAAAEVSE